MIRVRVPLDIHAVACNGSGAFALATPLRVRDLLLLAVREAAGSRAPNDKVSRNLRSAERGLVSGSFILDVNGRSYSDPDDVVVCAEIADLRFFLPLRRAAVSH